MKLQARHFGGLVTEAGGRDLYAEITDRLGKVTTREIRNEGEYTRALGDAGYDWSRIGFFAKDPMAEGG